VEVSGERVTGGAAAGERDASTKWYMRPQGKIEDYEYLFRDVMEQIFKNKGSFKVDGNLSFEFVPKAYMRGERLISPDTSFSFHRMQEGVVYANDDDIYAINSEKKKNPALDSYNYQKQVPPLEVGVNDELMPAV